MLFRSNGSVQTYSVQHQNTVAGTMGNVGVSSFTLGASSSMDVAYIDFDSSYGATVVEVECTGTGASAAPFLVSAKKHIAFNNGVPVVTTINTDSLSNATVAFTYVSGNRMKVAVTSTVAQIVRGGTKVTVSGGGSHLSGTAGVVLTMI